MRKVRDGDRLADNIRSAAILFLPKIVAEDDDGLRVGGCVLPRKGAAHQGAFAEDAKVILGDEAARHRGRFLDLNQVIVIVAVGGDGFE